MTYLPEQTLAELPMPPVTDMARWPQRCGRLEGVLEMLIIQAESAAEVLAMGDETDAVALRKSIERARAVLNEEPLS